MHFKSLHFHSFIHSNACRLASVWCRGRVDKSISRYASAGLYRSLCALRRYLGSLLAAVYVIYITTAVLHAYRTSDGGVRNDALMPPGRNSDHRKRQYVAAMPTLEPYGYPVPISWQRDMVVNPVGRHSGRSAFRYRSNIAATNFYI